jgi:hypothetical protein
MKAALSATLLLPLVWPLALPAAEQPATAPAEAAAPLPGAAMAEAAQALLASLDAGQAKLARFPFDSPERENWAFVPKERGGVPLSKLQPAQQALVRRLIAAALSEKGRLKLETIIALESVLAELEKDPVRRDPAKYYTAVFGEPGPDRPWGWRFEGHHVSVNLTLVPGRPIAANPTFLGANPAEVRQGPKAGTRPLAAEEELARTLAAALERTGRKVMFSAQAPADILTAADRQARQLEPVGVLASEMTTDQKKALRTLIAEYAHRHRAEIAGEALRRVAVELDSIRFGWAGSLEPAKAYYYRIQGSSFLIEAANTQNDANHIHTVWRDLTNDFGRDVLGEHMREHPH